MWGREIDEADRILYQRWVAIRSRCNNANSQNYKSYGGRGIFLSEEFKNYVTFVDYIKSLPDFNLDNSIDRINNDGGYERGNLKFSNRYEQSNNQRKTVFVSFGGERISACNFTRLYIKKFLSQQVARLARKGFTGEQIIQRESVSNRAGLRHNKLRTSA